MIERLEQLMSVEELILIVAVGEAFTFKEPVIVEAVQEGPVVVTV